MRYDEAFTYTNYVAHGLRHIVSDYGAPNNHVFHTVLVRLSVGVFGNHPWAIRLPAFVAGILLIPATFLAGRMLHDRRSALFASAVVATLGELVVFSTNARGYTLVALAFVILIVLAIDVRRDGAARSWAAFVIVAALGAYTVPIMLYPFGGVALWLAASAASRDTIAPPRRVLTGLAISVGAVGLLTALLYLPIALENGLASIVANRYVTPDAHEGFLLGLRLLPGWLWRDWMLGVPTWGAVALALTAMIGIVFHRRVGMARVPLWLAMLVWCAGLLLLTRRVPGIRVWLFLVPLFALVAGAGMAVVVDVLARLTRRRPDALVPALAVALAAGLAIHVIRTDAPHHPGLGDISTFRDAPAVAAHLAATLDPGDKVLTDIPSDAPLEYYLARRGVPLSVLAWTSARPSARARVEGSECLLVVVNGLARQSRASVLAVNGVDAGALIERSKPVHFRHGAVLHRACWGERL